MPKVKNADLVKYTVIFCMRFDPEGPNIEPEQLKPRNPTQPLASREQHFDGYATVRVAPIQRGDDGRDDMQSACGHSPRGYCQGSKHQQARHGCGTLRTRDLIYV